jgi:hypothetical protein
MGAPIQCGRQQEDTLQEKLPQVSQSAEMSEHIEQVRFSLLVATI